MTRNVMTNSEEQLMPTNTAAWLDSAYADFTVRAAPYTPPAPNQIVVRNRAVAVNPLDSIKQSTGDLMYRWLPYPSVLGEDVAGEVVEVGSAVTRFQAGDRVFAFAVGMEKGRDHQPEGAFQQYTVVESRLAAPIPDAMTFEEAAVLPLAVSTAASALFQKDQLGLRHPTSAADATGQVVVVWGASTSVGSNAVQLAVAAGYRVIATASPRNHEKMRELGATAVFDYASATAVRDVVAAVGSNPVAGLLAIGTGSAEPTVKIAAATGAKRVAMASPSVSMESVPRRPGVSRALVGMGLRLVTANLSLQAYCAVRGIRARFVWGSSLMHNEVGPMLWGDFLPSALAEGRYLVAPRPEVVGAGLEAVQTAVDLLRLGVSAKKLVVTL
jgi:NADPH:quinone reductase-like Zn-dependent oxidoreductase